MTEEIIEQPIEETVAPTEVKPESLSSRDALQHAMEVNKTPVVEKQLEIPTAKEVKAAVDVDPEPPSSFSDKGKDAWKRKDIRGIQEEYRRVDTSRTQEITRAQNEAQREREANKPYRELAQKLAPYIQARGDSGTTPEQAMIEAVALVNGLKSDKKAAKVELERLGFKVSIDEDGKPAPVNINDHPEITSLRKDLNTLLDEKRLQEHTNRVQMFAQVFDHLGSQKTRTGQHVYADLAPGSEKGEQMSKELGSLSQDVGFRNLVLRRFPNANENTFAEQAYISLGGKIAGEPLKESPKNNQEQITKQRRAAASSPGGIVSRNGTESLVGKLSDRAALAKAIELNREH